MTDRQKRDPRRSRKPVQSDRSPESRSGKKRREGTEQKWLAVYTAAVMFVSVILLAAGVWFALTRTNAVHIQDPVLKKAVMSELEIEKGAITKEDAKRLTKLRFDGNAHKHTIKSLKGLEAFSNLEVLDVHGNAGVKDLRPLAGLTKLKELDLHGNFLITDLRPLAGLEELESLDLERVYGVRDLSPLEKLPRLTELNLLRDYFIEDLKPVESMRSLKKLNLSGLGLKDEEIAFLKDFTQLEELRLQDNQLEDLSVLEPLSGLRVLNLYNNQVQDLSPIRGLTRMQNLDLGYNRVTELASLEDMTEMKKLCLTGNSVTDLSPLEEMTGLTSLLLDGNEIGDLSPLAEMTQMEELSLYGSRIRDLSPLWGMNSMTTLKLQGNPVEDISPLSGMTEMDYLNLAQTGISDLSPLWGMTELTRLEIWGNEIGDISALTGMEKLERLEANDNQIWSLEPLRGKEKLEYVELDGNNISDVSPLGEDREIALLYLSRNQIGDVSPLSELKEMFWLELTGNPVEDLSPVQGLEKLECLETETLYPSGGEADGEEDSVRDSGNDGSEEEPGAEKDPDSVESGEDSRDDAAGQEQPDLRITSIFPGEDNEGDAVLLQSGDDCLLMDTGSITTDHVIRTLKEMGISKFDLYLSHWHDDHYGQILRILDDPFFTVGKLYLPESKVFTRLYDVKKYADMSWWKDYQRHYSMYCKIMEEIKARRVRVTYLKKGSKFKIGTAKAEVLYKNEDPFLDEDTDTTRTYVNNTSLVTMITSKGGVRYLTCGDIEAETEQKILEEGIDISCDIFKMNHHGSSTSNTEAFLEAASPSYAFYNIRGQKFNKKPYFLLDTVTRLIRRANVFCGGTNGDLTFDLKGSQVRAYAQTRLREERIVYRDADGAEQTLTLRFNEDAPGYLDPCALPEGAVYVSGGSEDLKIRTEEN